MTKNKINITRKQLNVIGLLACAYFMFMEIKYDMGNASYKDEIFDHWYLPLSILLFVLMFKDWQMSLLSPEEAAKPLPRWIKLSWWFFLSCAGNWIYRMYCHIPSDKVYINEYIFAGIFLLGIPIQLWWHSYKNRK